MIGNDIIDLHLAKTESNWQRKGFLEKLFTNAEIKVIKKSKHPFLTVWQFWSMKETAYKVVVKQEQRRFFNPKKLECSLISKTDGIVTYQKFVYKTKTKISPNNFIYTCSNQIQYNWYGKVQERESITQLIAKTIHLKKGSIEIKKNDVGVPELFVNNLPFFSTFTLSHHGRFCAFGVTIF